MHSLNSSIHDCIGRIAPALKQLALEIHANPEIAFQEKQACALQVELLKKWGFELECPFVKIPTA